MTITVEQVIATLEEVVAEKGEDYVYRKHISDRCQYADSNGMPSCIVGNVVAKLDPKLFDKIVKFEKEDGLFGIDDYRDWDDSNIGDRPPALDGWEDETVDVLRMAQATQDHYGNTWGEALTAAKAAL